jgi:hypothetical protein
LRKAVEETEIRIGKDEEESVREFQLRLEQKEGKCVGEAALQFDGGLHYFGSGVPVTLFTVALQRVGIAGIAEDRRHSARPGVKLHAGGDLFGNGWRAVS